MTIKTYFLLFMALVTVQLSWNQTAFSVKEASAMGDQCTMLQIDNQNETFLPKTLESCTRLNEIQFTNNTFFSFDSTLFLPSVSVLNLSGTMVNTWELDKIAKAFPNLKSLNLAHTGLYHFGSSLVGFSGLETLDLSNNHFSYLPEDFQYFQRLKKLDLSGNELTNNVSALGYLWNLKHLSIQNNEQLLPGTVLRSISLNPQLRSLKMDYSTDINDDLFLLKNSPLQALTMEGESVTIPKNFVLLPNLKTLGFSETANINDPDKVLPKLKALNAYTFENAEIPSQLLQRASIKYVAIASTESTIAQNVNAVQQATGLDTIRWELPSQFIDTLQTVKNSLPTTVILTNQGEIKGNPVLTTPQPLETVLPERTITVVNPQKEQQLTIDGAEISIPKNAFLTEQGTVVQDMVKVEVVVFDNALETAFSNVNMHYSQDSIDGTLSSNGMIDFRATDLNGKTLFPNPNAPIDVSMPELQPNSDNNLFFYNDQTRQWRTDEQMGQFGFSKDTRLQRTIDSINKIDFKTQINIVPHEPVFTLKMKYRSTQSYLKLSAFSKIRYENNPFKDKTFSYVQRKNSLFKGQTLYIDTLLTKADVEKIMLRNKNYSVGKRRIKGQLQLRHEPRKVWKVTVHPDLEHDRFRLSFRLEDTLLNLPFTTTDVFKKGNSTVNSSQSSNTYFEFQRRLAYNADSLIRQRIFENETRIKDSIAENWRLLTLNQWQSNQMLPPTSNLRRQNGRTVIRLVSFGLVNADYLIPPVRWTYTSLATTLVDQNGKTYQRPSTIRVAWMNRYTYIDQPSEKVGILNTDEQIGILQLEKGLIGIVHFSKPRKGIVSEIQTITTNGLTQQEIIQQINAR